LRKNSGFVSGHFFSDADSRGHWEGHGFSRAAKPLKICSRFSARGTLSFDVGGAASKLRLNGFFRASQLFVRNRREDQVWQHTRALPWGLNYQ